MDEKEAHQPQRRRKSSHKPGERLLIDASVPYRMMPLPTPAARLKTKDSLDLPKPTDEIRIDARV